MTVPYAFGTATAAIPLSQLDSNFNTPITLGNTAIQLGNTVTTLNNMTLANVTVTSGSVTLTSVTVTNANVTSALTLSGLTASTALALDASKNVVSVTNTGTGNNVLASSPTLTTPNLGTPSAVTLTNATGLPLSTGVTGTLGTNNGGTGLTSFTSGGVVYAYGTGTLATGSALTFDGTNLGIGTSSPSYKLDVYGTGSQVVAVRAATSGDARFYAECAGTNSGWMQYTRSLQALQWSANGSTQHLTLDSSGNLGLGVTPSAWGSGWKSYTNQLYGEYYSTNGGYVGIAANAYYNGTNWIYKNTTTASRFETDLSSFKWYTAPSGTAGTAITFTQAMTLDASGNLGVGQTSPQGRLDVVATNAGGTTYNYFQNNGASGVSLVGLAFAQSNSIKSSITAAVYGNDYMAFNVGSNTERARIDSSGNLLVGATSSSLMGGKSLKIDGGTDTTGGQYSFLAYHNNSAYYFGLNNNGYVQASAVYGRTTASAANVNVDSSNYITRSTSALKYKQDIRNLENIDVDLFRAVRYKSKCESDDQTKDHIGIIADEVAQAGIEELVTRGPDGEVEGFQYERLTVVLLKEIQSLRARVAQLEQGA